MTSSDDYPPLRSPLEHGRALIELTRLMVARLTMLRGGGEGDPPRPAEAASAREIARRIAGPVTPPELRARAQALEGPIDDALAVIRARAARTADDADPLPFTVLERAFRLGDVEVLVVAALLAIELDGGLARAVAALGDDPGRRRPELGLIEALVGGVDDDRLELAHRALAPDGALRRHRVIVVSAGDVAYSTRSVRLSDRVVDHLRGHDRLDESLAGFARVQLGVASGPLVLPPETLRWLERVVAAPVARVLLTGNEGIGKAWIAASILGRGHRPVIRAELASVLADDPNGDRLAALLREAALRHGASIVLDGGAGVPDALEPTVASRFADALADSAAAIVITAARRPRWLAPLVPELVEHAVPLPTFRERIELWQRALAAEQATALPADVEAVAGRYALGGALITRSAHRAAAAAEARTGGAREVVLDDLAGAARQMLTHRLGSVAQLIAASFTWDDLVLPAEQLEQLQEVVRFARLRPYLLETWGFGRKLPYGRGISVILAGPPGTGKTMVAQILARELGYDLFRIDLSQVVNKYVGETEKNLARIFDEAETSHAVLFFDEADALFARRTDVRSANDRYANLEVNYLLQRMETYDGVTVLATNLEQGLDDAFKRRVRFAVQFELPEVDERERLWRSMFPPETPLTDDIEWRKLAAGFEMAGSYIKRAALRAALAAAAAPGGRPIAHADLLAAARQEYRDMGRISGG